MAHIENSQSSTIVPFYDTLFTSNKKSDKKKEIKKVSMLECCCSIVMLLIRTDSFSADVIDRVQACSVRKVPHQGDTSVFSIINFYMYLNL